MTYLYGYATPSQRLTVAELETRATWKNLDAEFKRRLVALFNASQAAGHEVGIGGGWRSSQQQEALFRSRYTSAPAPPGILWNGTWWTKKPGVASSAPPGRSYHEDSTPDGAIAADLIGDIAWAGTVAETFGLFDLSAVNDEPWHFQPVEIPVARRNFNGQPLKRFMLPDDIPLPPPVHPEPPDDEEEFVLDKIVKPSGVWAKDWWPWLACFTSGAVRPAVSGETATEVTVSDEGQYRRLCAAANVQLTTDKP